MTRELLDHDGDPLLGLDPMATEEEDGQVAVEVTQPGYVDGTLRIEGAVERRRLARAEAPATDGWEPQQGVVHASRVRVSGPGWRHLPVDVRFRFADGAEVRDRWDGRAAWRRYRFLRAAPLSEVRLDPDDELAVDPRPYNNGRVLQPDLSVADEPAAWLGMVVQWLGLGLAWL